MTLELCSRTGDLPGGLDGLPAWQLAETTILAFQLPFSRLDILRPLSVPFLFCLYILRFQTKSYWNYMNCAIWAPCKNSKPQSSLLNIHSPASTSSDCSQFVFYFTSTSLDFQTPISSHGQFSHLFVSIVHFCC